MEASPPLEGSTSNLHDPLCTMEITRTPKGLRRNKASSNIGNRAEHVLNAQKLSLEPVASIFKQILLAGVPECLCKGVMYPIFKAREGPSIYRGIIVMSVLSKLFAMVLELASQGGQKSRAYMRWGRLPSAMAIPPWTMCPLCAPFSPKLKVV